MTSKNFEKNPLFTASFLKPKKPFFITHSNTQKNKIFLTKKLKRNGLLEKKNILQNSKINVGRWSREEHRVFLLSCYKNGPIWTKIQSDIKTRTTAQTRSHAQKYVIHLCKKYNIEIKSRRLEKFISDHLNYPYKRRKRSVVTPISKMTEEDKKFIREFNFYEKKIDVESIKTKGTEPKGKIFDIYKELRPQTQKKDEEKKNAIPSMDYVKFQFQNIISMSFFQNSNQGGDAKNISRIPPTMEQEKYSQETIEQKVAEAALQYLYLNHMVLNLLSEQELDLNKIVFFLVFLSAQGSYMV